MKTFKEIIQKTKELLVEFQESTHKQLNEIRKSTQHVEVKFNKGKYLDNKPVKRSVETFTNIIG